MNITDREYLQQILKSAKLGLKEVETMHRIAIAEFNIKKEMFQKQIDSIELQLDTNGGKQ